MLYVLNTVETEFAFAPIQGSKSLFKLGMRVLFYVNVTNKTTNKAN